MLGSTGILCVRAPSMIRCSGDLGAQALDSLKLACLRNNRLRDQIPRRRQGNGAAGDDNLNVAGPATTLTSAGRWMIPPTIPSQAVIEVLDSELPAAEVLELLADQSGS